MMSLASGQVLQNRYQIDTVLGRGAAGGVYSGWDTSLNIPVAVKEQLGGSPQAAQMFVRQARALAGLRHPALPHIIDYFAAAGEQAGDCRYLVMEFIEGPSLAEILAESGRPLPEARLLPWIEAVCDAVAYLHAQNPPILHGDIKPANIRVGPQGRVALVDYGIETPSGVDSEATWIAGQSPADQASASPYAAPELLVGAASPACDQYALGAVMYTLLTGRPPVDALRRRQGLALPEPRRLNPSISRASEAALLRALALEPERRFRSVTEFHQALLAARLAATVPQPSSAPTQLAGQPAFSYPAQAAPGAQVYAAQPRTVLAPARAAYPSSSDASDYPVVFNAEATYPDAGGAGGRKWLIPLAAVLFGLLCLGIGIMGGYGLYVYVFSPAMATSGAPFVAITGSAPVEVATIPAATLPATAISVLPGQGGVPTLTPFATNTFAASATSPPPSPSAGLETRNPTATSPLKPTWQPCEGAPPSRLYVGDMAYVSFDPPVPNRVRRDPSTSAEVIGYIQPGEKVEIISGPMCANRWNWWQVRSPSSGMTGWTVEGDHSAYWLVPLDRLN